MTDMKKLKMHTPDLTASNIAKIAALFPHCVVEVHNEAGQTTRRIDFELLKQELCAEVIEGTQERYQLTWPGKREALVAANTPIAKSLRPIVEESVNFDTTQNLFIEGDNLDALKLLQESYLGKVKMIYIDPPYNTGKDFIYRDNFSETVQSHLERSGQVNEEGRLVANKDSNGRFHSDWLSMMLPRLKLARNLLRDDGVIFISIDDNEVHNLRKICDEIFGESNFVADFIRKTKSTTNDAKTGVNIQHENCICYAKNIAGISLLGGKKNTKNYKNPDNDPNGAWMSGDPSAKSGSPDTGYFPVVNPHTGKIDYPPKGRYWIFSENTMPKHIEYGTICFKKKHKKNERGFIYKRYLKDLKSQLRTSDSLGFVDNKFMNQVATKEASELDFTDYFSNPKPLGQITQLVEVATSQDSIILDFFAGSATTAHAVMQLNKEDGGKRRFILVQLPEECDEKSAAYKAGYATIAEIAKERIRRAGTKIANQQSTINNQQSTINKMIHKIMAFVCSKSIARICVMSRITQTA